MFQVICSDLSLDEKQQVSNNKIKSDSFPLLFPNRVTFHAFSLGWIYPQKGSQIV